LTASLALDHNFMFDRRVDALQFRVIGRINAYLTSIANLDSEIVVDIQRTEARHGTPT
jgi:hypothetical protein